MLAGSVKRVVTDLRGLPRQFWVLAAGILVFLIGVEMTYPYETLYLNQELGVSMTTLGVILGVTLLATLPLQVAGGAVCDKVGRRPVLIVAILASMTLYIGLGLTRDLAVIVALIAFEAAFGWAQFITASNAMIADVTTLEQRTEAFSVSRVALNAGISIGPFIALSLLAVDPSYRLNFFASGIVCAGFLLIVLTRLRETRPATTQTVSVAAAFRGYGAVLRDRQMVTFCFIALLPLYAFGQIWATMPVMLADLHGVTAQRWSVAMVVYGVSMVILQYPVIRVLSGSDHMLLLSLSCVAMGAGVGSRGVRALARDARLHRLHRPRPRPAPAHRRGGRLPARAGGTARPLHGGVDDRVHGRLRARTAARRLGAGRARRPDGVRRRHGRLPRGSGAVPPAPPRRAREDRRGGTARGGGSARREAHRGAPRAGGLRPAARRGAAPATGSTRATGEAQARRVFSRMQTATATNAQEASTGCQTGAHHSLGIRNSRSRSPSDDGQRSSTQSQT